ncbi:uncharacterized protein I206_104092 [Kwoniella pini CBS 10737]|uniref:GAR domain-containing protein n=1 Tax=Kwoniella pini CBS 10737 TaxID=1296096 RepID=A0AAJ8L793_9TREE
MAIIAQSTHDDLRDLAPEEAQELRDFLEKRRWFEGKLKLLDDLPSIYPFLHPALISEGSSLRREGESSSQWQLPGIDKVKEWQEDRDKLEEEVLLFDGGDLGRMKEMTRAATLLPLTPPSTHLVSITLDLIVLIDRILTLLRKRGQLLDLTLTRLHWDQMRWEIGKETKKIRDEIAEIVQNKGKWLPAVGIKHSELSVAAVPQTPSPVMTTLPRSGSFTTLIDPSNSPSTPPRQSASKMHFSPRHSLHIPLLHSQLVSLNVRHRNLTSNQLTRSSILLDKMIDLAAPLRGLGDINGPAETESAVPDVFLDLQDEVDARAKETSDRIDWCKQLEKQWEKCRIHYAASREVLHRSEQLSQLFRSYLNEPATGERHAELSDRLTSTKAYLPNPIDHSFSGLSHPSYPEIERHNTDVVEALQGTYNQARDLFSACEVMVTWYGTLEQSRRPILYEEGKVLEITEQLQEVMNELSRANQEMMFPESDSTSGIIEAQQAVLQHLEVDKGKRRSEEGIIRSQVLTLAIMKYQVILRKPPLGLDHIQNVDSSIIRANAEAEDLLELANSVSRLVETSIRHQEMLGLLHPFLRSAEHLRSMLDVKEKNIQLLVRQNRWPESQDLDENFATDADELSKQISALTQNTLPPLMALFETQSSKLRTHVEETTSDLSRRQNSLHGLVEMSKRLHDQARAMRDFESRQAALRLQAEELMQELSSEASVDKPASRVDALQEEYEIWVSSLEIPFLSDNGRSSEIADGLPSAENHDETDQAVIDHVNISTLQVASAIANCRTALQHHLGQKWSNHCGEATTRFDQLVSSWKSLKQEIQQNMSLGRNDMTQYRDSLKERKKDFQNAFKELEGVISNRPDGVDDDLDDWAFTLEHRGLVMTAVLGEMEATSAALNKAHLDVSAKTDSTTRLNDVFGPAAELPGSGDAGYAPLVNSLQAELDKLNVQGIAYPKSEDVPSLRRLPDLRTVKRIRTTLNTMADRVGQIPDGEKGNIVKSITSLRELLPRLDFLAEADQRFKECDYAISNLLKAIDVSFDDDEVQQALSVAGVAHHRATSIGRDFDDHRVVNEEERITRNWSEIRILAQDYLPRQSQGSIVVPTTTTPRARTVSSRLPRLTSSISRATFRSTSNSSLDTANIISPVVGTSLNLRDRAVSDTPTRHRVFSMKATGIPQLGATSLASGNGISPRPSRLSMSKSVNKKEYVADARSKLDLAVGQVIHVPIRPVGVNSDNGDWTDQSGQYWIGAEGRAKLCFCRILRSRTVMVRVGGGWVELFLLDHFAEAVQGFDDFPENMSSTNWLFGSNISSQSVSLRQRMPPSTSSSSLASIAPEKTPARPNGTSPVRTPSGPGSPLQAFQFIRKASESPNAREKEKERFRGRRSILGKDHSSDT